LAISCAKTGALAKRWCSTPKLFADFQEPSVHCGNYLGWCVGSNPAHLAKLPHFPSFLSLFWARANCFDGGSDGIKLFSKLTKASKSSVLVKQFFPVLPIGALPLGKC